MSTTVAFLLAIAKPADKSKMWLKPRKTYIRWDLIFKKMQNNFQWLESMDRGTETRFQINVM